MKKIIILLLVSFFNVFQAMAVENSFQIDSLIVKEISKEGEEIIDSCIIYYQESKHDSDRINSLMDIGIVFMEEGKFVDAITIFEESLRQSKTAKNLIGEGNSLYHIGHTYSNSGNNEVALKYYFESISVNRRSKDYNALGTNLNNIAIVYSNSGKIEKAIDYYKKSLIIFEKFGDEQEIASVISNMSGLHIRIGEVEMAMKYNQEALGIYQKINDIDGMASSYNTIGFIHYQSGNEKLAFEYLEKGYDLAEGVKRKDLQGQALVFKGYIYGLKKEYTKAQKNFKAALEMFEDINHYDGISNTLSQISNNYRLQGDYTNALLYAKKGMKASESSSNVYAISESAWLLSNINEKRKNYKDALELYKYHIKMRDSIVNEDSKQAIIKQQMNYEHEKKETKLTSAHDKKLAVERKEKQQQRTITVFTIVGLIILLILLVFIFNRLQLTRKQKLVIEEQKVIVDEKNKEILDSISYAKRIQLAILPPTKVVKEYLKDSFILYKPKDIVAGDFYWMEHRDSKVLFAAADCTGHGVPGAMISVVCNNALNRSVREHGLTDPGEILFKTREIVIEEFEKSDEEVSDGMDIALCSLNGNTLQYAGAHNPLWLIRNGEIIETKANKQPIGKFDNPLPYTTHTFKLQTGDAIYIFTDGYVDQFGGEKGKKLKAGAFKKLLLSIQDKSMEDQKVLINENFETWKGDLEQIDDVCVIGVRF